MNLFEHSGARISNCKRYRYSLTRRWRDETPRRLLCFVMLNPSTADASDDDPTITRCIHFARRDDYHGIEVVNLFAWRATHPKGLKVAPDPIGPENDAAIWVAASCWPVVVAWGAGAAPYPKRVAEVLDAVRCCAGRVLCLGRTKGGHPRHPLYLKNGTPLVPLEEST